MEKGNKPPYLLIPGGWRYTGIVIEHDGITTYVYEKVDNKKVDKTHKVSRFKASPKRTDKPLHSSTPISVNTHKEENKLSPHKVELPQTGQTNTNPSSALASILLALGSIFILRRKKDETHKN